MEITKCSKCKSESTLIYLGKPLCEKHWKEVCYPTMEKGLMEYENEKK